MNFALTEDQVMIRDAADTFLRESCSSEAVRAVMATDTGFDPLLWRRIGQELGWCGIAVAERHGGLGLGPVELMLVQELAGYRLLCAPFFASACLATSLLCETADETAQAQWLPGLAAGELVLSAALDSDPQAWTNTAVVAQADAQGWQLSGLVPRVPDGSVADRLLVVARTEGELGLFSVDCQAPGVRRKALQTWDASRRFAQVELSAAAAQRCDAPDFPDRLRRAAALVRLYLAAEQLGGAQRCLDLTVAYVQERKQFGRVIGAFQAVKHRCAEMMVRCEATRSAVYGAAALAASAPDLVALEAETAAARSLATEALHYCAGEAIQLHGGVGFTWEYDPQLFFKRGQASAHWLGTPQELRGLIAARLIDSGELA